MSRLSASQIEGIATDLAAFADPGIEVALEHASGEDAVYARWEASGRPRQAKFMIGPNHGVFVETAGATKPMTYAQFLAGPEMADLRFLAQMMLQADRASRQAPFIPPLAKWPNSQGPANASEVLLDLAGPQIPGTRTTADTTTLVFVTADAGVGKTSLLRKVANQQAGHYMRGQASRLFLYVDAQGSALARLDDALAKTLQDLRSKVTYHTVASLVRNGLLIPIVDGFDELIGRKGMSDDSFNSLSGFLERLDGRGIVVASARNVYYELEFSSRAETASDLSSWSVDSFELQPWTADQVAQYVREVAERRQRHDSETLILQLNELFDASDAINLRSKPFFVANALDLLIDGRLVEAGGDLLLTLVNAYLLREAQQKLVTESGAELLTPDQLGQLFVELALEMWRQETRELDAASVREVVELFCMYATDLNPEGYRILIERAPTLAFLGRGTRPGSVVFEHEIFFSFFLARSLVANFDQNQRHILARGALPPETARLVTESLLHGGRSPQDILTRLSEASAVDDVFRPQVRENAGLLSAWALRLSADDGPLNCSDLVFADVPLKDAELQRVRFRGVTFRRTDLSDATWSDCTADDCLFEELLVSPRSRLGIQVPDPDAFSGLRVAEDEAILLVYDRAQVLRNLAELGVAFPQSPAPEPPPDTGKAPDPATLELVGKLCAAFQYGNPLPDDDTRIERLARSPRWKTVLDALIKTGLVTIEHRPSSGPRKDFYRRHFLREDLLAPSPASDKREAIDRFWAMLKSAR